MTTPTIPIPDDIAEFRTGSGISEKPETKIRCTASDGEAIEMSWEELADLVVMLREIRKERSGV